LLIGIISDIHGNLEALEAALKSLERHQIEKIYCLGDVVGYGANPGECLELVRQQSEIILMGNHDAAVAGQESLEYFNERAQAAVIWTKRVITAEQLEVLRGLPMEATLEDIHFVHSAPQQPRAWDYIFSPYDARAQFAFVRGRVCFVGHSHVPGLYRELGLEKGGGHERSIINVGSVGQPRDGDPRLCYVIYDSEAHQTQFIREEYDIESAAAKILEAGLPRALADRLYYGQ
jgi:diadenosine tetraphosphatase ApaH/serine/threonine PP2A family protein phosphatase